MDPVRVSHGIENAAALVHSAIDSTTMSTVAAEHLAFIALASL
jgi:hypothetical protein